MRVCPQPTTAERETHQLSLPGRDYCLIPVVAATTGQDPRGDSLASPRLRGRDYVWPVM
jgi:hypothetical protein